jgi:putative chitobiose transport system substrate-binding protein
MMRKKLVSLVLTAALTVSVAAGCSKTTDTGNAAKPADTAKPTVSSAPVADKVELEFWTINLKKNFQVYIEGLVSSYESSHPNVKIKWVDVPGADVDKKLITALSSDSVPDVVNETTLGLSKLQQYDAVYPLSDLVDKSKFDPYIKGLVAGVTYKGKIMGLPWYNGGPAVGFVNKELYQKAGLDPEKPAKSWDELLAYGAQIHAKLPKVYGSNDIPSIQVLQSEGLPILSEDKKTAVFNSPEHVAYVEKFVQAYKTGAIAPGAVVKDDRQLQQTLDNELTAHVGQSLPSGINNWEKNNPSLLPKLKVVPPVTGKAGLLPIKDFQLFVVPKKSKHPKEAAEFALYVTSPEKQLEFCKLVAIFPSTEATLKDPYFTNVEVKTIKDEARKMQVANASKLSLGSFGLDKEQEMVDNYNEQIRAVLLGQKSVKQALDDAVNFWNPILAKQ